MDSERNRNSNSTARFAYAAARCVTWSTTCICVVATFAYAISNMPRNEDFYAPIPLALPVEQHVPHLPTMDHTTTSASPSVPPLHDLQNQAFSQNEIHAVQEAYDNLLVKYFRYAESEIDWAPVEWFKRQENLQVVAFSVAGTQFAFALQGMCNANDAAICFTHGKQQVAVTYWPSKNRVRVFSDATDVPKRIGLIGMTCNYELAMTIDGEPYLHSEDVPMDEINFSLTDLATWFAAYPGGRFCATGMLGY